MITRMPPPPPSPNKRARETQRENSLATNVALSNVARVQILAWVKFDGSFRCSETGGQFFWFSGFQLSLKLWNART